jgi:peroxiredoxin/sugar lactone lactonase YvrE
MRLSFPSFLVSIAAAALAAATFGVAPAAAEPADAPEEACPLMAGQSVPSGLSLRDDAGGVFDLDEAIAAKPSILVFYRGGWCAYCSRHLGELGLVQWKLIELGYQILAVSPDRPAKLAETKGALELSYRLLSDSSMLVTDAFGLAYRLDEATVAQYREYDIDLEGDSGETHHLLPVPAAYVVGTDGVIDFAYANPDYQTRISADVLLAAAQDAMAKEKNGKPAAAAQLVEVATSDRQWTGIAVSREGRVFVNFPRWSPDVPISVGELTGDGSVRPYPSQALNGWKTGDAPGSTFVCVQSVHVDAKNRLWILDPANPMFTGVVEGGAKLMRVNLADDSIERTYVFDESIAPAGSYLNDVRIDTESETAFITESGLGAIVVVDLKTGQARRLLDDHPATKAEDIQVVIGGRPFPAQVHADGIALDAAGGWLYFQALTGRTLYRVPTAALRDFALDGAALGAKVEVFAQSGVSDGLLFGPGGVYVSALEAGAIHRVDPAGQVTTVVEDSRIVWPDSFALGADGAVWFTTAQIHLGPNPPTPYRILRIPPRE